MAKPGHRRWVVALAVLLLVLAGVWSYRRARQVAKASGAELARTLQLVVRDVQPEQVWIMANSMGAQVVVDAFSLLYQDREFADFDREIEHVVLTRGR